MRPRKSAQLGNTLSQHRRCWRGALYEGQEGAFWSQAPRTLFFAVLTLRLCCHPRRSGLTFWPFLCLRRHLFLSFFLSFLEKGTASCNSHGKGAAALRPAASAHRDCRASPHDPREAGPGAAPGGEAAAGRLPPRPRAEAAVTSPPVLPRAARPRSPRRQRRARPLSPPAKRSARPPPGAARRERPAGGAPAAAAAEGPGRQGRGSARGRRGRSRRSPPGRPQGSGAAASRSAAPRSRPALAPSEQSGTGDLLASGCRQLARAR